MAEIAVLERTAVVRHGRRLEYFTIAWNALEGLVAVVAGAIAGSISLVGFGIDSFIEVTSGSVLLCRMSVDAEVHERERNEKRAVNAWNNSGLCLAGRNASTLAGKAKSGPCSGLLRHASGRQTNGVLYLLVDHSAGGAAAQYFLRSVVGRSRGGPHYGPHHR